MTYRSIPERLLAKRLITKHHDLCDAKLIVASNVSTAFDKAVGGGTWEDIYMHLNSRLPYPNIFIEWKSGLMTLGIQMLCDETYINDETEDFMVAIRLWWDINDQQREWEHCQRYDRSQAKERRVRIEGPAVPIAIAMYDMDLEGHLVRKTYGMNFTQQGVWPMLTGSVLDNTQLADHFMTEVGYGAFVVNSLHQKGAYLEPLPLSKHEVRRTVNKNRPLFVHNIVKIRRGQREYELFSEPTGDKLREHWCRGHFKTYTDAAPLFGKYTGTYWIPAHIRGNAVIGTVTKDYHVDLSEEVGTD